MERAPESPAVIAAGTKIADIQFLRAVAVGLVLIAHLPALLGWHGVDLARIQEYLVLGSGVDLFFAISGFVICRSFIAHNGGRIPTDFRPAALPFWIRRAFRILPSAWFWIATSIVATVAFNRGGHFGKLGGNLWDSATALFQVSNLSLGACEVGLIKLCADGGVPNGIYWTLSLEEQFYILFPIVLIFTPRRLLVPLLLAVTAVLIFVPKGPFGKFVRFDGLLIGVLLGIASFHPLYARLRPSFLELTPIKLLTLFILLALVLLVPSAALDLAPFRFGLLALVCGLWVFIASHGLALPASPLTPFLMWVGSRSYALYLCHFIAFCTTREFWFLQAREGANAEANARYLGLGLLLLALYAEFTYRVIERPFIRRGAAVAARVTRANGPLADSTVGDPERARLADEWGAGNFTR